jgi:hypothetical protein
MGVRLKEYVHSRPGLRGVMLAGHGIICWADTSKDTLPKGPLSGARWWNRRRPTNAGDWPPR